MSESVEIATTTTPASPTDGHLALCRALVSDPRIAGIVRGFRPLPTRPTPADVFMRAYDETLELLRSAEDDGTLDILMTIGGKGPLLDRITDVRTQRAVMRAVLCEAAEPANAAASNTAKKKRGKRKKINVQMLAILHDDPSRIGWSAKTWALRLDCAESSVKETTMWDTIQKMRDAERKSQDD